MNKKNKEEFVEIVSTALNEVVVPALEDLEERMKKNLEDVRIDLGSRIDSLDRKFDAQQERLDRHDKRITKLEEKAQFMAP